MKSDSQLITLPVAAVLATLIMVGMPLIARMQPKPPNDPWFKLRPPTYESGGRVLHNGKPIKGAVVCFTSTFENPHRTYSAMGVTNADGRFLLNAFRGVIGAPAGLQRVSIQYMVPTGRVFHDPMLENEPLYDEDLGFPEMASGIPRHYSDAETSGLTVTITEDGPNDFLFELVGDAEPPDPRDNPFSPFSILDDDGSAEWPPAGEPGEAGAEPPTAPTEAVDPASRLESFRISVPSEET